MRNGLDIPKNKELGASFEEHVQQQTEENRGEIFL